MTEVKKIKKEKSKQSICLTRALFDAKSFNEEANTVDVVYATEEPVLMRDWDGEFFYEVLSFDPSHVRQDWLRAGAPVLDNHNKNDSVRKVQVGVVEDAKIDGKKGVATVRFSKREDIQPLVADVKDGIVKNISAGYRVYQYRDVTKQGDKYRTLLAIDWEPVEISLVPVPADYRSQIRSAQYVQLPPTLEDTNKNNVLNNNDRAMKDNQVANPDSKPEDKPENKPEDNSRSDNGVEITQNATVAERKRGIEIRELARKANLEDSFADELINNGTVIEKARQLIIEKWAEGQSSETQIKPGSPAIGKDRSAEGNSKGFEEAITIRSFGVSELGKTGPETEYGKRAANGRRISLLDHGIRSLELIGVKTDMMSEHEIFSRSMATGDFPIALANVMNKTLRQRYEQADPVWKKFARKVSAKDFKPLFSVQVDGKMAPGKLTEKGEYPYVVFKEAGDNFKLDTYGLATSITRQMFINDDLGAFEQFAPFFSDGMIDNQTELVYAAMLGTDGLGRVLGEDNTKLFNAAKHNNYDATGAAMSIASFTAAVSAMRRQKTLGGRRMKQNRPKYLVIPPELETLAYQLINATLTPNTTNEANPFKGMFVPLVEDFFEDTQAWFLISDPARVESVKYATLDGQDGIFTEQWWNPKNDCWEIKARNDFSATFEEFRGVYKNKGVAPQ